MSDENALVPTEERTVDFYGDEIQVALIAERVYIPVKPICDHLGIDWPSQSRRIKRDPVLTEVVTLVETTTAAGQRETTCLPLEYLNGWLFGISANKVREDLREKVIQYQRDCYLVLFQAFQARATTAASGSSLSNIRDMALAIAHMAEQQMAMEQRLEVTEARLDKAATVVGDIGQRLRRVEGRLRPAAYISDEQAAEISLRVRALAGLMGGHADHYQTVFAELYRRFGVSSYKLIRLDDYPAVLDYLEGWRQEVVPAGS